MFRELFYTEDLENEAEELFFRELKNIIDSGEHNFCRCSICIQDIAAIVLNSVKPMYSSNRLERIMTNSGIKKNRKVEEAAENIRKEIIKAIALVNAAPHH